MGDGYFYTLSAIAQSFAAIIALNSIFVIYKMQLLNNRSNDLLTQLRMLRFKEFGGSSGFKTDRDRAKDWINSITNQDLLKWAEAYVGDSEIVAQNVSIMKEYIGNNNSIKKIMELFKTSLILNGIIIAICFILLSLKEKLLCLTKHIEFILCVVVLFSLIGLFVTIYSVFKIIFTNGQ